MTKYVAYLRVSTKEQGRSGLGVDAQMRDMDLYINNYAPPGSVIASVFKDVRSGADGERTGLREAIEQCKETGATLLVSKLDRLSRKVSFIATLMEDKDLTFKVAQMPHADPFQLHIYAALAQQERDFISQRTKAALREAKAKGVKLGGLRKNTAARNAQLAAKAGAFAVEIKGKLDAYGVKENDTLTHKANVLNNAGVPTANGGSWSATQVRRILKRAGNKKC